MVADPFEGFATSVVDVGEATIFTRRKGAGHPLLLLHGFPETHVMWHRVAPVLAEAFTVVCADLRGYGASSKPASRPDHAPYSKRAMAADMVRVMDALGFPRFGIAGHDRGGRVAYRMALDYADCIERLAVLDIVATSDVFRFTEAGRVLSYWPWALLSNPAPLPERLMAADPEAVVDDALGAWGSERACFPPTIRAAYVDALRNRESIHAICEEYRAAATIDAALDRQDRAANRRIGCPTLVLWSEGGGLDTWYASAGGPLGLWRRWAADVSGGAIRGGHFFPEQNPQETIAALHAFFAPA